MDTIFWYSIGMLVLALAVGLALCTFGYRWSRHDGYEAGYNEGRADKATEVMAERHTARHAKTEPRTSLVAGRERAATAARPVPAEDSGWYVPPPGPIRSHTSAVSIAPVILPEPGTYLPQAGRDSHPGTAMLPRFGSVGYALDAAGVRPRLGPLATTGEQRAVTDEFVTQLAADTGMWLAQRAAEDEAYRAGLAS